jgi:hypothetical protein
MSDAEPPLGTSAKILSDHGALDVVSVKYQPPDPLLNFLHNLGSSFDRKSVARWLEHACACRPKLAFPYASGLCLTQDHAWMNRYAYPFSPEYVSAVLDERLIGVGKSAVVRPGDIISIESRQVRIEKQACECHSRAALSIPRQDCHRHQLRPSVSVPQENQPQHLPRRPSRRHQRGRPGYLVGQLYGLRFRLYRSGGKNSATSRESFRPESVTYVLGTICYLCVRSGQI